MILTFIKSNIEPITITSITSQSLQKTVPSLIQHFLPIDLSQYFSRFLHTYQFTKKISVSKVCASLQIRQTNEVTGGRPFEPIFAQQYLQPFAKTPLQNKSSQNKIVSGVPITNRHSFAPLKNDKFFQQRGKHLGSVFAVIKNSFKFLEFHDSFVDILSLNITLITGIWKK